MANDYESLRNVFSTLSLGGRPLPAAVLTGGAGMLLAAALAPKIMHLASRANPFSKSLTSITPDQSSRMKRRFGMAGGLAGAAWALPLLLENMDEQGTLSGLVGKFPKQSSVDKDADNAADVFDFADTRSIIESDSHLSPPARASILSTLDAAMRKSEPESKIHGMITTTDLIKGLAGGGLGYAGTALTGSLMGSLFGLPSPMVKDLSRTGALAGALLGSGIIS